MADGPDAPPYSRVRRTEEGLQSRLWSSSKSTVTTNARLQFDLSNDGFNGEKISNDVIKYDFFLEILRFIISTLVLYFLVLGFAGHRLRTRGVFTIATVSEAKARDGVHSTIRTIGWAVCFSLFASWCGTVWFPSLCGIVHALVVWWCMIILPLLSTILLILTI